MKNIIINTSLKTRTGLLYTGSIALMAFAGFSSFSTTANAQMVGNSGELNIPYGRNYRDENAPYNPTTRNNGNRVIINGRIMGGNGSTLSGGLGGGFFGSQSYGAGAGAGAIGNQLNVVTVGNWNTVIIDSTQINNGNQTVNLNGATDGHAPPIVDDSGFETGELNGGINLDD
ncbi:MAG: holdfast anchoring protein HfaA [Robiginitomaculum sp.]|nr:holdfast anchoring protein HfaA [Robiginitomaculum sp.]